MQATRNQALDHLFPGTEQTGGFTAFFLRALGTGSIGLEILLNCRRGARSQPFSLLYLVLPLYGALIFLSALLEPGSGEEMASVTLLVLVALWYRRREAWRHLRAGALPKRHTRFLGDSVLIHLTPVIPKPFHFLLDHWFAQKVVHPLIGILAGAGIYLSGDSHVVAGFFVVSSVMSGLKNSLLFERLFEGVLTYYDATLAQHVTPRLVEQHRAGAGAFDPGVPVSSDMLDVLLAATDTIVPDMETIVDAAMGQDAHPPDGGVEPPAPVPEEVPHG
jgi:hypothetical protein